MSSPELSKGSGAPPDERDSVRCGAWLGGQPWLEEPTRAGWWVVRNDRHLILDFVLVRENRKDELSVGQVGVACSIPVSCFVLAGGYKWAGPIGLRKPSDEEQPPSDALCESAGRKKTHESGRDVAAPSDSQQQMAMPPSVGNAHNNTKNK